MPASAPSSLLSTFHDSYHDLVRFVARRAGPQAARDLVHDAWVRMAERQQRTDIEAPAAAPPDAPAQRAYLYTVAENLAIDHLRRGQRTAERFDSSAHGDEQPTAAVTPDVADAHALRQALAEVERTLQQLPPRCREIFLADRIDGASHAELAAQHGVSVKTVEREVMRAMDGVEASLRRWRGDAATQRTGRRRALSTLLGVAGMGAGSSAIWLGWRQWVPQYQANLAAATGRMLSQPLPDGSTLLLDATSRAEVQYYASLRQVRLVAGNAFFSVVRDTERPFVVQAQDVRVTVLGTRFEVAIEHRGVRVAVESGRVHVQAANGDALELSGGESALVNQGHRLQRSPPTPHAAVADWRNGWLEFDGTPLAETVARLARYSPQPLMVAPEAADLPVLARVRLADIAHWLRLLPGTLPVRLEYPADGSVRIARKS